MLEILLWTFLIIGAFGGWIVIVLLVGAKMLGGKQY